MPLRTEFAQLNTANHAQSVERIATEWVRLFAIGMACMALPAVGLTAVLCAVAYWLCQ